MEEKSEIVLGTARVGEAVLGSDIFWGGIGILGVGLVLMSLSYFYEKYFK